MKNIKAKIDTSEMIYICRGDVHMCIKEMNSGNMDMAKYYAREAYMLHRALNAFSYKKNADFSTAYDELANETNINELFKYPAIADYVNTVLI